MSKDTGRAIKYAAGAVASIASARYLNKKHQLLHDIGLGRKFLKTKLESMEMYKHETFGVVEMWERTLERVPNKVASVMIEDDGSTRSMTFMDIEKMSNRIAHYLTRAGLKRGDTMALFMENRPEFIATWLGAAKIGVKIAMINTSVTQKSLLHSLKISGAKLLIVGSELADPVSEIHQDLMKEMPGLVVFSSPIKTNFCEMMDLANESDAPIPQSVRKGINMNSPFGYIYTSGTTGLPKAAVILHSKVYGYAGQLSHQFGVEESDVVLTHLPLFHSAGGLIGAGFMILRGCTLVMRKRFSAKMFFEDATKHGVTVVQYIGEICKYLLFSKPSPYDRAHKVRVAIGNGLRPEIWNPFQERFHIPEIGEFYGSTEGNGGLVYHGVRKGGFPSSAGNSVAIDSDTDLSKVPRVVMPACGRMGTLACKILGLAFVKFDVVNEEPIRDRATGFCIHCDANEPGELLFKIKDGDPASQFAGYQDKAASEKKVARDVFVKGDKYFRTGDLLRRDEKGFIHFVDRIGDTFRWKGENCSTTEVTEVMQAFDGIEECNVYGVQIPNNMDGRAPMACLTLKKSINFRDLASHLKKSLPSYARPLFLRVSKTELAMTATLKQQKNDLRNEGMDITKITDEMLWLNPDTNEYEPFGLDQFRKITQRGSRL